jgi:diacylglycerol O-acyltransferase 2, plant
MYIILTFSGPALFAIEPHDILPLSIFAFNDCLGGLKGHTCVGCVTSICFFIPIMKHIYTWVHARSADKKNLIDMLRKGISPVLCPGGVQEVTLLKNENECVLYLNNRLGFIKLALQQGVPIIPCFCFGLRKTFNFWIPRNKVLTDIGRYFGVLPMLFFGVWNLPFSPGKPVDYVNLIGSPIKIPKIENPSEKEIEKYHGLFIKALSELYEGNKNEFGMGQITLRIA